MTIPVTPLRFDMQKLYTIGHSPLHKWIYILMLMLKLDLYLDKVTLFFTPTRDLSELSMLQVSISRAPRSSPVEPTKFAIDLKSLEVLHGHDRRENLPLEIVKNATELREHVYDHLKKVQDYRDRLINHGVIADSSPFLQVDLMSCPLCRETLRSCADCGTVVACPTRNCPALAATPGQCCEDHLVFCCQACLDAKGISAFLVQCPTCTLWHCCQDFDWCFGRVTSPAKGSKDYLRLEWDDESVVRAHPPKPGPCLSCANSNSNLVPKWKPCNGYNAQGVCPAKVPPAFLRHRPGAYCDECFAATPGRGCECGLVWTCDACFDVHWNYEKVYAFCPRCERTFCVRADGCDYCHLCQGCEKFSLCDDCIEEDGPGEEETSAVRLTERCDTCSSFICETCSPDCMRICAICDVRACSVCTPLVHCSSCQLHVCRKCIEHRVEEFRGPCPLPRGREPDDVPMNEG